jgi:peptide/nickel transport system ATP-binding protein
MTMTAPLLEVRNLGVTFPTPKGPFHAVRGVSWSVARGETLAILGESGSGKSVSASTVMNLIDTPPAIISSGEILFHGRDLLKESSEARRQVNGKSISMIFQDPLAALNPVYPVGWQIAETMRVHGVDPATIQPRVIDLLARVGVPEPEKRAKDYPHQFSGGQRQRIMIASAIALEPELLIADEPTSALDVTVQAQVLDLLKALQRESGMGMVIITHDLGVVHRVADHVVVMQAGEVVERGPVREVMTDPRHPYTRRLLASAPGRAGYAAAQAADAAPLLEVRDVSKVYFGRPRLLSHTPQPQMRAVDGASFTLARGEILGVVGESGSGKSTLARMLLGLDTPTEGTIAFEDRDLARCTPAEIFQVRRRMQFVFQDPTASLNPLMTIEQIVSEPWAIHKGVLSRDRWRARVEELLEKVGLRPEHADRHPHQFSGGQRQRIAIARALALEPDLIVCDEAVSALDVSVQAQVIDLLKQLRQDLGLAYVFIAHDLALVRDFATAVLVMYRGRIVEAGPTAQVYDHPRHDYTRALLAASDIGPGHAAA